DELADLADVPGRLADPLVVAGDLNATEAHRPLARLLDRFTDTASVTGSGWRGTWPTNRRWPPVLRLDRILVRGLVTLEHEVGPAPGSDHRHVRAVVEVASPA
ncbi:MAG: endonuclease/exonuclease/phosphatase family protein, partial [Actinomyces sp.]